MRSLILSLVLGAASLGLLAVSPAQAEAQSWRRARPYYGRSYYNPGYSYPYSYGYPSYSYGGPSYYSGYYGYTPSYYSWPGYRSYYYYSPGYYGYYWGY